MSAPISGAGLPAPAHSPLPTAPARPAGGAASERAGAPAPGPSFAAELRRSAAGVEFSKHALQRIERRGIPTDPATVARLRDGIDRAAAKGAREAVVLVDRAAFVVSVANRTVITAVDSARMRDHVFTNIDAAAIA